MAPVIYTFGSSARRRGKPRSAAAQMAGALILLVLLLFAVEACQNGEEGLSDSAPEHDLILVSIDTLRADRLGCYGAERDPDGSASDPFSLRWLAERGTRWETCWATAGKTNPSLASFWTGLQLPEHGVVDHITVLDPQRTTFAQRLRQLGFRSFARVANRALGGDLGFSRGFEDYAIRFKQNEPKVGEELLTRAAEPIRNGEKLLLWAHYMSPHQPYEPAAEHDLYSGDLAITGDKATLERLYRDPSQATPEIVEHLKGKYDGDIRQAAHLVQGFLRDLDRLYREADRGSLLENAIVVFFSDHGEELADHHGYFPHAKSLYSGVIRVPLIIAGPGYDAGRVETRALELTEVLPMVVEGRKPARQTFVANWKEVFYSIRDEHWTLVHHPCEEYRFGPSEPPRKVPFPYPDVALFDRRVDPTEQVDVAEQHVAVTRRLLQELLEWHQSLDRVEATTHPGVDEAVLEELGYATSFDAVECAPWVPDRWSAR